MVHYREIERQFINQALIELFGEGIDFPVLDTIDIETKILNKLNGGFINRLKGGKPKSVRIGQSCRRYGLPDYTPHHALTDKKKPGQRAILTNIRINCSLAPIYFIALWHLFIFSIVTTNNIAKQRGFFSIGVGLALFAIYSAIGAGIVVNHESTLTENEMAVSQVEIEPSSNASGGLVSR